MKLNENVKIVAKKCVLVPYEPAHVEKYHQWMEDEEIRRLTGSERLSLEEEYKMQKTWRDDEDKLTFIVLSKEEGEETSRMLGDVNLFISSESCEDSENESEDVTCGEVEVMIAEPSGREKGIGQEAVSLIISWAIQNLGIHLFRVKITDDNTPSLQLFEKKLGFSRIGHSSAFQEYTLQLNIGKSTEKSHYFSSFLSQNAQILEYH